MLMIRVRFTALRLHYWAGAPTPRFYLREPHEHEFIIAVEMEVHHVEREVEFFDFLDRAEELFNELWPENVYMPWSCEEAARQLLVALEEDYPERAIVVSVSEDARVGASVTRIRKEVPGDTEE